MFISNCLVSDECLGTDLSSRELVEQKEFLEIELEATIGLLSKGAVAFYRALESRQRLACMSWLEATQRRVKFICCLRLLKQYRQVLEGHRCDYGRMRYRVDRCVKTLSHTLAF